MDVSLERIRKSYGGTTVLHDVSVDLRGGLVHGLVGENGAGKSTLARILCGAVRPERGAISVGGDTVRLRSPRDALRRRIALITQEGAMVPGLSVLDNVCLGTWAGRYGWRVPDSDRRRFAELTRRTGFELDPRTPARDLSLVQRQQVEIMRALAQGARLIALDEPTALLTPAETGRLLGLVRRLATDGIGVVLISHRLGEVLETCDIVTVLRDGRHISTTHATELTPQALLNDMIGRPVETLYPSPPSVPEDAPVLLAVHGLARGTAVRDVSLEVRAGEIVGLAGLVGSGRTEVLRMIFGADPADTGQVTIAGRRLSVRNPARAKAMGTAMIPESRAEQGLALVRPAAENLAMAGLRRIFVRRRAEDRMARQTADDLDIRGPLSPRDHGIVRMPAWTFSGGNQQKLVFGKWLTRKPYVLLADEPTRGVDVAAKIQIHRLLVDLAARGVAVLLVSSEVEEVLGLAHRTLVMREGRIAGEFARGSADAVEILSLAGVR